MKLAMLVILVALNANAEIKPYHGPNTHDNPDYHEIYLVNGSRASDSEAFQGMIAGKEVYRCVNQEISMSKSGRGAAMRNVKKKQ